MIQVAKRDLHVFEHDGGYYLGTEDNGVVSLIAKLNTDEEFTWKTLYRRGGSYYEKRVQISDSIYIELDGFDEDSNWLVHVKPSDEETGETVVFRTPLDWKAAKSMIQSSYRSRFASGGIVHGSASPLY